MLNKNNFSNVKIEYSVESKVQKSTDIQSSNDTKVYTQVLKGSSIGLNTNYCVGSFKEGALHLNPISHILQFRPEFGSIDENNQNRKNRDKGKDKNAKNAEVKESQLKNNEEWLQLEYIDPHSTTS